MIRSHYSVWASSCVSRVQLSILLDVRVLQAPPYHGLLRGVPFVAAMFPIVAVSLSPRTHDQGRNRSDPRALRQSPDCTLDLY